MLPCSSDVLVCRNAEAAAQETADHFVCAATRSVAERGVFHVAVPGGSSPRAVFQLLASQPYASLVPWERTAVFFTDERCVPPDHEQSNYRLANELLLSKVPIPSENVHRFAGELPPIEAAAEYEQTLRHIMGERPTFDLILLGMGEDTHTASLFPNTPALDETRKLAVANYVRALDVHRLTLTIPVIKGARRVLVLALGSAKARAVNKALRGEVNERLHPVQSVAPTKGRLLWIVDQEAAADL
jgi:6-phosphogluconolactonase